VGAARHVYSFSTFLGFGAFRRVAETPFNIVYEACR
jgi:hypothetical protein